MFSAILNTDVFMSDQPHFLQFPLKEKSFTSVFLYVIAVCAAAGWVVLFSVRAEYGAIVALVALLLLFITKIEWGIYLIALAAFFHAWEIDFSRYPWAKNVPYLPSINAPVVDFIALFFLIAVLFAVLLRFRSLRWQRIPRLFPKGIWYSLFLVIAWISATTAYEGLSGLSLKYFFRPIVFVYVLYVVLTLILLQRRAQLERVTLFLAWLAVAIAVFGLFGFVQSLFAGGWPRVEPFAVFGIAPLGYNHNMIAEVLVALLPFSVYMAYREERRDMKILYMVLSMVVFSTILLTLSRAAWVVLFVYSIAILFFFKKELRQHLAVAVSRFLVPLGILIVLSIGYMSVFLGSHVVASSNSARLVTTQIALFYTKQQPILGYGPGMFIPLLTDTSLFALDFGDALDAHGIILKLVIETGIFGMITMGMFLWTVLHAVYMQAKKNEDVLLTVLFFSASGAVMFQLFNTSYFNSHMWFPIGLALAGYQLSKYGDAYASQE
ncbi:MAG: hypothetical protein COU32_01065 [Candidatus Magasanikbacteria bacterium CG10_big_fil_rev_8_21_14_0_10_42_10]|uniref:O-antigen ligase-related domain-containing protein n=1 Tax=Candidatus Magasanikbacteria bacterium CG10_big_fil_rev_8_21_14_0_10_42_10 TaxID=1974649 RepID=A0A2H0TWW7_9BACT|nr:MAG: hypothetical protein COU32_01065 [Candidatus Magasanikbacteria bacterium CG10_big_fil_rev_8_21_14_0_10_42_10]